MKEPGMKEIKVTRARPIAPVEPGLVCGQEREEPEGGLAFQLGGGLFLSEKLGGWGSGMCDEFSSHPTPHPIHHSWALAGGKQGVQAHPPGLWRAP